jgi:hypothetical protein
MAMSQEQAYVTESRGKKASHVYTNDYDGMVKAAERSGARMFASEVKASRKPAKAAARTPAPTPAAVQQPTHVAARTVTPKGAESKPQARAPQKKGIAAAWARIHERATALMQAAFGLRQRENLALAAFALGVEPPRSPETTPPARPVVGKYTQRVQNPKIPEPGLER